MRVILLLLILWSSHILFSCRKDLIVHSTPEEFEQSNKKIEKLKEALASSKNGWVLMVKPQLNTETYTPIVLKFDAGSNRVHIKTVYGITADQADYYRIETEKGIPQLSFSPSSVINTILRSGNIASDMTDHVFNILDMQQDTITIQCARNKAFNSTAEKVIYKLFKRPESWTWADDELQFDFASVLFRTNLTSSSPLGQMKIRYLNDHSTLVTPWQFSWWNDQTIGALQSIEPFSFANNASGGGFKPSYPLVITAISGEGLRPDDNILSLLGHNAISFLPFARNRISYDTPFALTSYLKTHYLVFKGQERAGMSIKMEFEAYDSNGNTIITAIYNNNL